MGGKRKLSWGDPLLFPKISSFSFKLWISKVFIKNKYKYFNKKNIFYRPWGSYTNLFKGKNFLVKELNVKSKGILSLQKHYHRSEHWLIIEGKPMITLNKKKTLKFKNESCSYIKKCTRVI